MLLKSVTSNYILPFSLLALSIGVLLGYFEMFAIFQLLLSFVLGFLITKKLSCGESKDEYLFVLAFSIFAFVGSIILLDNATNYGHYWGHAFDDWGYFNNISYLLDQQSLETREVSIFAKFLVPFVYPIASLKEVSIAEVLPLVWMMAALNCIFLQRISRNIFQQSMPIMIILLAFALQYSVLDSFTRMYRDSVVLFFVLASLVCILEKRWCFLVFILALLASLRFANVALPLGMLICLKLRLDKKVYALIGIGVLYLFIVFSAPYLFKIAQMYGSDISRLERKSGAFVDVSGEDIMSTRLGKRANKGSAHHNFAYSGSTPAHIGLRGALMYFYPMTFQSPVTAQSHYARGNVEGIYFYKIINWVSISVRFLVIPFVFFGLFLMKGSKQVSLLISTGVFLLLVLMVSGQSRHAVPVWAISSLFAFAGWNACKSAPIKRILAVMTSLTIFCFALLFNLKAAL